MEVLAHHKEMANAIRFLAADGVEKAKSGHPGMPMGMADVATVLFGQFMKYDPSEPKWIDRDRFVLSAGHGSMLLYSLAYLTGYKDVDLDQLKHFRQLGYRTAGHPETGHVGIADTTTGPLGQGITNAVGFALAERMLQQRYGKDVIDHYTYAIAGDGCLMEGISQEAISLAGHLKLSKLIVLWDDNGISIDGEVTVSTSDDHIARFKASNWNTDRVDGHDQKAIAEAIARAKTSDKPTLIACKTVIGFGAPTKAGTEKVHGAPLGADELAGAREKLEWNYPPFVVPPEILNEWRKVGGRGQADRAEWEKRHAAMDDAMRETFDRVVAGKLPDGWLDTLNAYKRKLSEEKPKVASRKSSQDVLEVLTAAIPEMIGGSADLTGSNLTDTKSTKSITPDDMSGRYIHYGIREFGMSAVMNGLALHGGLIPYGGTFLVFSDYMRNGMRMSALMEQRVIYVLTHDSIGLGEDGPTHQPVEHLASLRSIPNLMVFRPCDAVETAECWALAVSTKNRPSALALSRQNLPTVRTAHTDENLCARGAYVLMEAEGKRDATILATGSEIAIAMDARAQLKKDGINVAVVSMPCWELFEDQSCDYRKGVLGSAPRVSIEAAGTMGWDRYVGPEGRIIGMHGFGASGPIDKLYEHFGITARAVVDAVKARTA